MTYKVYYTTKGTVYDYRFAFVEANSEEEAKKKVLSFEIDDEEVIDTEYDDDFEVIDFDTIEQFSE